MEKEFLKKLATIIKEYDATFYYTIDDDGIHIDLAGKEIYVGWLDDLKDIFVEILAGYYTFH